MIAMSKVKEVLRARLDALETAGQDAENQIGFFEEHLEAQRKRLQEGQDEYDSIYAALNALDAAFPPPQTEEEFDDIPF